MLCAMYAMGNEMYDAPNMAPVGRSGNDVRILTKEDMIELPEGADLMLLPGRSALVGQKGKIEKIASSLYAVAAMLPMGYTRTYLPAFELTDDAPQLPLYGYAAVAFDKGKFYVAAVKTDDNAKWTPTVYNTDDLKKRVDALRAKMPTNRIVEQTAHCSLEWHCCTAENLFYHRWEAGIPASPVCNANCIGCISLQEAECCPSPQSRITFSPTAEEMAEVGIYHLTDAPDAIVSFGQGCEGEPSLAADRIAPSIRMMREATPNGQININTNAGYTEGIKKIVDAGLDTMRVSIISGREETYQAYYRGSYSLSAVKESIAYAKQHGVYVSLNLLLFPGLNDRPEEIDGWREFLRETGVDMIQLRNLNIDPDYFLPKMPAEAAKPIGVKGFLKFLAEEFPEIRVGSFSRYVKKSDA